MAARGRGLFSLYIYIENFKNLVRNHWTDLQKCSLVVLCQDCSSYLNSSKNMATRWRGLFSYIENFKNLLVRNHWTDFNIPQRECFLCNLLPRLYKPSWFIKKHGSQGVGLIFPIYLYRKVLKSSCQKPLDQPLYNVAKMFPWWSSTKIVQAVMICQKTWPLGGGAYFPYISI